jgi:hypothetical protein
MASIVNYGGGLKRIEFPNGPRKMIRLGRVNAKVASMWLAKVEAIIADRLAMRPHDAELSKWLGDLDEKMLARLRTAGLADGVGLAQTALGDFLERQAATMSAKQSVTVQSPNSRRRSSYVECGLETAPRKSGLPALCGLGTSHSRFATKQRGIETTRRRSGRPLAVKQFQFLQGPLLRSV